MGMLAFDPGICQMLFSPGHQQRSSVVISQVYIHCGAGPAVVLWGNVDCDLAQMPHVRAYNVYSQTKARLVLTARARL